MEECMLLRLMTAGAAAGGFALVTGTAAAVRKIWRHMCQGKERRV